ncbi:glucose-1-phosphate thymidylyltransferase [Microgenomates group bacterium RBG_16_45_19]|nr:MAG: glucose-1-phosphate thymidylyltransferase [Microgenomates group bacterium RBG_16_45_19]
MKAIIAAGGSGTRLRPLTFSSNKHLLPLANKPLLLYPIEAISETGIKEVGIIVNETRPAVEALLGSGGKWGLNLTYIEQAEPLGLAHVVLMAQAFLAGEPFVYHLGDNIFSQGIKEPFKTFEKEQPDALLTLVEHEENWRLGVPYFDEAGNLMKVVEKPEKPPNKYGVPGLYFFNHHVFEAFTGADKIKPSARGELEITDLYTYLLDHHYRVLTAKVPGRWLDPGKFTDMLEANTFLLQEKLAATVEGEVDQASILSGKVAIGKGTRIVNSRIIGPTAIAGDCLIEDAEVGPNVAIDTHCKLETVTIKNSILMQDATLIDLKRPLVDSMVGKNTEIWEENQANVSLFIGDHCRVRLT